MTIEDLFAMNDFRREIFQMKMNENDDKIIILCPDKLMVKNMIT
jgi:hypothetical protein